MCKARLTISNHASILDWLQRVRMAACCPADHDCGIPPMRDAWLADGIQIRLPGMIIKHAGEKANSLDLRSEEHTSELQSLMRISYAVFCLKKKQHKRRDNSDTPTKSATPKKTTE